MTLHGHEMTESVSEKVVHSRFKACVLLSLSPVFCAIHFSDWLNNPPLSLHFWPCSPCYMHTQMIVSFAKLESQMFSTLQLELETKPVKKWNLRFCLVPDREKTANASCSPLCLSQPCATPEEYAAYRLAHLLSGHSAHQSKPVSVFAVNGIIVSIWNGF